MPNSAARRTETTGADWGSGTESLIAQKMKAVARAQAKLDQATQNMAQAIERRQAAIEKMAEMGVTPETIGDEIAKLEAEIQSRQEVVETQPVICKQQ